jgi:hypothetical protein
MALSAMSTLSDKNAQCAVLIGGSHLCSVLVDDLPRLALDPLKSFQIAKGHQSTGGASTRP